jgi:hypothetical protein
MTVEPRNHPSVVDRDRIAAELAALGEPALEAHEPPAADDPDVAFTVGLMGLGEHVRPVAELAWLSEIERRRAWGKVRRARDAAPAGGGLRRGMVPLFAALAAAAAVLIMPRVAPPSAASAEVEGLASAAHAGLEALGDATPGARAREISAAMTVRSGAEP